MRPILTVILVLTALPAASATVEPWPEFHFLGDVDTSIFFDELLDLVTPKSMGNAVGNSLHPAFAMLYVVVLVIYAGAIATMLPRASRRRR